MKWNILVASLVLTVGMCSQSYGFELLDTMLGIGGHHGHQGCCEEQVEPTCNHEPQCSRPLLDFSHLKHNRCPKPKWHPAPKSTCCSEPEPTCGHEEACGSCGGHGLNLNLDLFGGLHALFDGGHRGCGECGGQSECGECGGQSECGECGGHRGHLRHRGHRGHRGHGGCDSCGGDGGVIIDEESAEPEPAEEEAELAPVIDPEAYIPSQRRDMTATVVHSH